MVSSCVIRRASAAGVLNESTGNYAPTFVAIYSGKCRVKSVSSVASNVDSVSQLLTVQSYTVSVPVVGSELVAVDDVVEVTVSPLDAGLVGRLFRVAGLHTQTHATARRLVCELVT